jgi:hypothetical protein
MFTGRSVNSLKTMSEIDKLPTKDLTNRYNIRRTALYTRFAAANITPEKDGTRSYISKEELAELDRLDSHIKTGGKLEDFQPTNNQSLVVSQESAVNEVAPRSADNFTETLQLVEAIARHIAATRDPLQHYAALERAIASGWILSTAEVRSLIGTKPRGDRFQRGSFVFIKSGKIGNQAAWRVAKVIEGSGSYKV